MAPADSPALWLKASICDSVFVRSHNSRESVRASVGTVLETIGSEAVRLVSDPAGLHLGVSHVVLHDPYDPPLAVARGLLLGVGVRPGPDLRDLLRTAAARGHNAVATKAGGRAVREDAAAADEAGIALLVVEDGLEWLHLERLVTTALDGVRGGEDPVLSSLTVGDLFSLANAIAAATGGATAIEDVQRRVLAYSTLPDQVTDEERRDGILGRQVPDLPDNERQYRELYASSAPLAFEATDTALGRLACAVRAGGHAVGSIWLVDSGDNLVDDAARLLAGASDVAALHLMRARSSNHVARQHRADQVRALLARGDAAAAHYLGVHGDGPLWVLAVHVDSDATTPPDLTRLVDVLALELEASHGRSGCAEIDGRVYAVLTEALSGDERTPETVRRVVSRTSTALRLTLTAGLAGPVPSSSRLTTARSEADAVLSLIALRPLLGPVVSATEVRDELTLQGLSELHVPAELSTVAATVLAADRLQGTTHATLLRTWLACLGDVRRVAERLAVHPNTVRYRLGRLRETAGLDPDRPDQLVLLWLALELEHRRS